jgi:arsenate reductase
MGEMIPRIQSYINGLTGSSIPEDRIKKLQVLIDCISDQLALKEPVHLNFICTHNSRRSQLAQVWAQVFAHRFNINIKSSSGGVEVTEFNEYAVSALKRVGFSIEFNGKENPRYQVRYSDSQPPLEMFSKLYKESSNGLKKFIAVMTCSDADSNCPMIPGVKNRISLTYTDPKIFDGTEQQDLEYDETCFRIAAELYYVFSKLTGE